MRKIGAVSACAVLALFASSMFMANANEPTAEVDVSKLSCAVNPKQKAKPANAADYKGGKVYTCCGGCLAKFKGDSAKYATFANHQLVASKQFKQVKCPISGGKVNASKSTKVGGVSVGFCCGNCLAKVEKAGDLKAQATLVFADKAFKKGFVTTAKKK